jgi:tRNA 5-methylaminomethyl-2-thiouridine biosynthesis bifunctional protein
VFLQGNRLPERFAAANHFTVAELGFGTGLSFLLTAQLFHQVASKGSILTYVAYEKHPFAPDALAAIQSGFSPHLISAEFAALYAPQPGWNTMRLGAITLHLYVGDALDGILSQPMPADAWFLDGFSPDTNPDMWSPTLLAHVAAHTTPGGTASSYSVAHAVREALTEVGFTVEKAPGHPPKRHMLRATKA